MNMLSGTLNQKAVWWSFKSKDGYGKSTFNTAISVDVRWQDVNKVFINQEGKQEVSQSIVYAETEFHLHDYLFLGLLSGVTGGALTDPFLVPNSLMVKGVNKSYDLPGKTFVSKVFL